MNIKDYIETVQDYEKYQITRPLLAASLEDPTQIKFPVIATPKLDGIRVLKVGGQVVTRKFKPLPNHYARTLLEKVLPEGIDGEIMTSGTFNDIQSQIMSHDGQPSFTYHAFDYLPPGYKHFNMPYEQRLVQLNTWWEENHQELGSLVTVVRHQVINNLEELGAYEAKCLDRGYEGVMIRRPDGKYKCGRSTVREGILIKIKQFKDSEAVVLGFVEKMKNTNPQEEDEFGLAKRSHKKEGMVPAGTLGALQVKDIHTNVQFEIGSGFDDITKLKIWTNQKQFINKIVKYKYQEVGVKDAPRFPVFLGFRHEDDL